MTSSSEQLRNLCMHQDVPEFLLDSIAYCDNLTFRKNEKSCFVLTKSLKFYEFRRKQLLNSIDLSETCFAELKDNFLKYDGRKCQWFGDPDISESSKFMQDDTTTESKAKKSDIKFGKYIYKSFDISKLYLILNCWNSLVVLQRLAESETRNGFRFVAEYENVFDFKIVPSTLIKYQSILRIHFVHENHINTDFEENETAEKSPATTIVNQLQQKSEFKQLLERVRQTKAELQFHKEITHKRFQSLKNQQSFGCNLLRSTNLDEKPMLARCGDVWMRITTHDELIIGTPLINNCAPPNLTILKNLQPVLNTVNSDGIYYQFRIYQLQQTFENLETLETFFQSEDPPQFEPTVWGWETEVQIFPTSFVVLLIKIRLSELMLLDGKCQLFVRFQAKKTFEMTETETFSRSFDQHLFIKSIDFQEILHHRQEYEIKFNEKTLHQDFLSIAMSGYCTQLQINFATHADRKKFENLLAFKFDFEVVHRGDSDGGSGCNFDVNTDEDVKNMKCLPCSLYYNRKPSSLWFGALVVRTLDTNSDDFDDVVSISWTFYNKHEEKAFLMFKLIFSELITIKCNVKDIKQTKGQQCRHGDDDIKGIEFENAMRQEIAALLNLKETNDDNDIDIVDKVKNLIKLQFSTDILAADLCHEFNSN